MFGYLESRAERLRGMFNFATPTAHSKLSVLRICNQLLRRLSRSLCYRRSLCPIHDWTQR